MAAHRPLPIPAGNLRGRCWVAVNSLGAARIAGKLNLNVLFSHLRTVEQYREYRKVYAAAGGTGLVAANRPVFVGRAGGGGFEVAEPALRVLWRGVQAGGEIWARGEGAADGGGWRGRPVRLSMWS